MELKINGQWTKEYTSRRILGNFVESGIGRQIPGMWSEMIQNRSFRPKSEYKYPMWSWLGLWEDKYNENAPFWHSGYEENDWETIGDAKLSRTWGSHMYKGNNALIVKNPGNDVAGITQKRIHLVAGREYCFSILGCYEGEWSAAGINGFGDIIHTDLNKLIKVTIGAQSYEFNMSTSTRRYEWVFTANKTEITSVDITLGWTGGMILSGVSLMPTDNMKGWRKDVVEKLREISPSVIRFPGGCFISFFNWEMSVGERDYRPAVESVYWGGIEENDVGIDEFMDLSEMVGFEPQICVNMMTSSPFKARQQIEYLNADENTGMGRWRMLNGHKEPYNVRLIELDNEPGRKWTCEQYAYKCCEFIDEMNLVGSDVEYILAAYSYGIDNLENLLNIVGKKIKHIGYRNSDPEFMEKAISIVDKFNKENNTQLRLANTEWPAPTYSVEPYEDPELPLNFDWSGRFTNDYKAIFSSYLINWNSALNTARRTFEHISYGGEYFEISNFNNLCNTWGQNIINGTKDSCYISCCGHVFKFINEHFEPCIAVNLESEKKTFYALLTKTQSGKDRIYLVNQSYDECEVKLPEGDWKKLVGINTNTRMGYVKENDDIVKGVEKELNDKKVIIPGLSVCVIE